MISIVPEPSAPPLEEPLSFPELFPEKQCYACLSFEENAARCENSVQIRASSAPPVPFCQVHRYIYSQQEGRLNMALLPSLTQVQEEYLQSSLSSVALDLEFELKQYKKYGFSVGDKGFNPLLHSILKSRGQVVDLDILIQKENDEEFRKAKEEYEKRNKEFEEALKNLGSEGSLAELERKQKAQEAAQAAFQALMQKQQEERLTQVEQFAELVRLDRERYEQMLPDRQALHNDRQNVHRHEIINAQNPLLQDLLEKTGVIENPQRNFDALLNLLIGQKNIFTKLLFNSFGLIVSPQIQLFKLNCKSNCEIRDTQAFMNPDSMNITRFTYKELFDKIVFRILQSRSRDELAKRLLEEVLEGIGYCMAGKITRILNTFTGFDEFIQQDLRSVNEKLQEGFGEISKLNISLEEKRARGQRLLDKLQVPEAHREVWLDALGGEDDNGKSSVSLRVNGSLRKINLEYSEIFA